MASTDEHIDAMNQVILDAVAADGSVEVPVAPSTEQITAAKQAAAEVQAATAESEAAVARATAVAAIKEAQEPRPASPMAFVAILVAVVALLFADAVAIAAGMIILVPDQKVRIGLDANSRVPELNPDRFRDARADLGRVSKLPRFCTGGVFYGLQQAEHVTRCCLPLPTSQRACLA